MYYLMLKRYMLKFMSKLRSDYSCTLYIHLILFYFLFHILLFEPMCGLVTLQMSGFTQSPLKFTQLKCLTLEITFERGSFDRNSVFQLTYLFVAAPFLEDLYLDVSSYIICTSLLLLPSSLASYSSPFVFSLTDYLFFPI